MTSSSKTFARIGGHTGLELLAQALVIEAPADQHHLVAAGRFPVGVVDRKALASQMKHMAPFAFVKPKDALGPENFCGQLVVEEVLELTQAQGLVAAEGK